MEMQCLIWLQTQACDIKILRILLTEEGGLDINTEFDLSDNSYAYKHGGTAVHRYTAFGKFDDVKLF